MSAASFIKNDPSSLVPLAGYAGLITVPTAAKSYADMTIPAGGTALALSGECTHVGLNFEGGPTRMRADGTAPTSTIGRSVVTTTYLVVSRREFEAIKLIRDSGAGADVKVWVQQYKIP